MRLAAVTGALGLGLLGACAPDSVTSERETPDETEATFDAADFEALRDLGYVDFGEAEVERDGLLLARPDPERGYVLVNSIPHATADLVGPEGEVVRTWSSPDDRRWFRTELSPAGDLYVIGRLGKGRDFLACYDFGGVLLWKREMSVHHDLDWSPEGELVVLGRRTREVAGALVEDNPVWFLGPEGRVERELSLLDVLVASADYELPSFEPSANPRGAELFHANSVAWMNQEHLVGSSPVHERDHVAISVRNQNLVVVIDVETEELVWSWGPGEVELQHEVTWLPDGNLLLFDNGSLTREYSRLVQVDPRLERIVWTWTAPERESFYSPGRGTVAALARGGWLVADSNGCEVFEVAEDGAVAWRWLNPRGGPEARGVVRAQPCDKAWVEEWLRRER